MFSSLFHKKTKSNAVIETAIEVDKSCDPEELAVTSTISNKRKRQHQHQPHPLRRTSSGKCCNKSGIAITRVEKNIKQISSNRISRRNKKNKINDKISHEQLQLNKAAAMELSNRLQDLSNKKNLREALKFYWDNIKVCDGHHASIIINCCSRCGAVEEGEKVLRHMIQNGQKISVQANTALLKGYVHSGLICKAVRLFEDMCSIKDKQYRPNVRTFNTLARGCLWNAATLIKESNGNDMCQKREITEERTTVIGGVLSLEEAWLRSKELHMNYDASSFEYSVTALCSALRVADAEQRIAEMKEAIQSPCDLNDSLIVCLVALSRAYAMLGRKTEAKKNAKAALSIILHQPYNDSSTSSRLGEKKQRHIVGGKQGWKTKQTVSASDEQCGDNRSTSNAIFRNHRISELKMEAEAIVKLCQNEMLLATSNDTLVNLLASRLLCFCGGGTTDLNAIKNNYDACVAESSDTTIMQLLVSLWFSFGLSTAAQRQSESMDGSYDSPKNMDVHHAAACIPDSIKDRYKGSIQHDGFVNFPHVFRPLWNDSFQQLNEADQFMNTPHQTKPIYVELGSGSGDWIVSQAIKNPSINFVAVELRADRVAQTFAKLSLSLNTSAQTSIVAPLCNLCCVGSECGIFLKSRVQNHTISKIFVNHPEPPTQTCGADHHSIFPNIDKNEPAHMLNSSTLLHAAHCLKLNGEGQLIIVTDNLWYGRFVCLTLVKLLAQHSNVLQQVDLASDNSLRLFQTFIVPNSGKTVELYVTRGTARHETGNLWQPEQERGTSYFDRLWRAGGGKHAHKSDRYIIIMETYGNLTSVKGGISSSTRTSILRQKNEVFNEPVVKKKSGKKGKARSPQKQAIRNKKRLARRKL